MVQACHLTHRLAGLAENAQDLAFEIQLKDAVAGGDEEISDIGCGLGGFQAFRDSGERSRSIAP